jgi:hypothetical protein
MGLSNALFVVGLTIDIIGAYYLAQGFITKDLDGLTFEGTSGYGSPPNLRYIKGSLYQKAEAQIGFFLLAIGFFLQMVDYVLFNAKTIQTVPVWGVILGEVTIAICIIGIARYARRRLFETYSRKMARIVLSLDNLQENVWRIEVARYLLPSLRRNRSETEDSFVRRILSEVHLPNDDAA